MSATQARTINSNELDSLTSQFMGAVSGTLAGVERDEGLLVTNEDIRKIKRYVNASLALPTEVNLVEQLYNLNQLNIPGLSSVDMLTLYKTMKDHANTWSPLELQMKKVGADLHVFADNLTTSSNSVIDYLKTLPAYISGLGQIGTLSPEEIDNLPAIKLSEDEQRKIPVLLELVDELKAVISQHSQSTTSTKDSIAVFKQGLTNVIKPALGVKIALAQSRDLNAEIQKYNQRLDEINTRISEKQAEIEQYSKSKWWGLLGGAVGFIISSTIYGDKAKQARMELEALATERRGIADKIATTSALLAQLLDYQTNLQDLQVRVEGAAGSASNLESLWELIQVYIDSSSKRLEGVTNAMYLVSFVARLTTMVANWTSVKKQAGDLLTAFNNASRTL